MVAESLSATSRAWQPRPAPIGWPLQIDDRLTIDLYDPQHRARFAELNLEWLERYFEVEPIDRRVLEDPEREILAGGGEILFALVDGCAVGTVALQREAQDVFELTKMGVTPSHQGGGIGRRLLEAALQRARERKARSIVLYSSTALAPAIALYRRVGFVEVPLDHGALRYSRSNVKMALWLTDQRMNGAP